MALPALQCPIVGCDKPNTIKQTSFGYECESFACDNEHTFGLWVAEFDEDDD